METEEQDLSEEQVDDTGEIDDWAAGLSGLYVCAWTRLEASWSVNSVAEACCRWLSAGSVVVSAAAGYVVVCSGHSPPPLRTGPAS